MCKTRARVCLAVLLAALALCPAVQSAEASAFLPHSLDDICPILPEPASSGVEVTFVWPSRGVYVYSSEVQLQLQALDQRGSDIQFSELAVELHVRQPQNHNSRPPVTTHVIGASSVLMKDLRFGEYALVAKSVDGAAARGCTTFHVRPDVDADIEPAKVTADFHRWYYSADVWRDMYWMGVKLAKVPSDMWLYQELLVQLRPSLVVEFGSFQGGSALYFATVLSALPPLSNHASAPHKFKILTVDIHGDLLHPTVAADARIEAIAASSTDASVEQRIRLLRQQYPGPMFAILDSDHSKAHVLQELRVIARVTSRGDRVIVEDSNVNGHPVGLSHGPGPYEAIEAFCDEAPDVFVADAAAEGKFGFTAAPAGWLVRA